MNEALKIATPSDMNDGEAMVDMAVMMEMDSVFA